MSQSATPATRNEATRRLKPPKMTPSAELNTGTATGIARTVANGCEWLRTVADGCERLATSSEHTLNSQTLQSETGTLATHSGKTLLI